MEQVEVLKNKYIKEWNRKFKEKWKWKRLEKVMKWEKQVIEEIESLELISFRVIRYKTNYHALKGIKICVRINDTEEHTFESLEYRNSNYSFWFKGTNWNYAGDEVMGEPVSTYFKIGEIDLYEFENEFSELINPKEIYEMFLSYQEEVCRMLNEIPHTFVVENGKLYVKIGEEKFDIHIK